MFLFQGQSFQSVMQTMASEIPCQDWTDGGMRGASFPDAIRASLRFRFGSDRCDELQHLCDKEGLSELRFVCPVTCNCDLAISRLHFRTITYGCLPGCKTPRPCIDQVPDE